MAKILFASIGSYGDINPNLAVARGLIARGHQVALAAPALFEKDAARLGTGFHPLRLDADPFDTGLMARVMDPRRGSEVVIRELIMPRVRDMYEDLTRASKGADLLVSHSLTYALPVLAEKTGARWLSMVLQPMMFLSAYDPPVLAPAPWLQALRPFGPALHRPLFAALRLASSSWSRPVRELRRDLGLPDGRDPIFEGQYSPRGTLAMFSSAFGPPQPDWPAGVRVCGFPFLDEDFGGQALEPRLASFLDAGEPPIVFTLGSSAVLIAGRFYADAAEAARRLGRRAVLLAGPGVDALGELPDAVLAVRSAPYHLLFPRAAAIVHSGGVGTTAQALRSGRPQLVVAFAHDQFDNAARVIRLGCGSELDLSKATPARLERAIRELPEAAAKVGSEDGVRNACDAIEATLRVP